MTPKTVELTPELHAYMVGRGLREPPLLRRLREETAQLEQRYAYMQVAPEEGRFLGMLVELTGARRCIELGTFTGYSALSVALALPEDGRLVCCDISEEWTGIARRYWKEAGVAHKIDLRLAPGLESLDALLAADGPGAWDMVFIDADKDNYIAYYERALQLLRTGGLVVVDNVLWDGEVVKPENMQPGTVAIRAFNDHVARDERVSISMIPLADGVTLLRKR